MLHTNEMMFCGSFAKQAGSLGMAIHNTAAMYYGLDFLYKSFSVDSIEDAIKAIRTLKMRGAGISMPYKVEVMKYLDECTEEATKIGAVNTVVNENGKLIGHNTDWIAASQVIKKSMWNYDEIAILGNGGYAKAVAYAVEQLGHHYRHLVRYEWDVIPLQRQKLIFNCTPVEDIQVHNSVKFIDCSIKTPTGKELAVIQAGEQFKLYTGKEFPLHFLKRAGIV